MLVRPIPIDVNSFDEILYLAYMTPSTDTIIRKYYDIYMSVTYIMSQWWMLLGMKSLKVSITGTALTEWLVTMMVPLLQQYKTWYY